MPSIGRSRIITKCAQRTSNRIMYNTFVWEMCNYMVIDTHLTCNHAQISAETFSHVKHYSHTHETHTHTSAHIQKVELLLPGDYFLQHMFTWNSMFYDSMRTNKVDKFFNTTVEN